MKSCVCGFSSLKYTTLRAHKKFCMGKMVIHNNREDYNKTEVFADALIINPSANPGTLFRLCEQQGISLKELTNCLNKKAELLVLDRKQLQKPEGGNNIKEFRKQLREDIKEVGPSGEVEFLENLIERFTSLASIKNDRVFRYFTDETFAILTLKISHLQYKVMIARDNQVVKEHEVITSLIAQIESLDVHSKIPRLERASSNASSSTISSVDDEVVEAKGFWGFGK